MTKKKTNDATVTLINISPAVLMIDGDRVMPDETFEVAESDLALHSIQYLFGIGSVEFENDRARTAEMVAKVEDRRKPDPWEGKTKQQLEDGGEY